MGLAALGALKELDDAVLLTSHVHVGPSMLYGLAQLRGASEVLLNDLEVALVRPDVLVCRIETATML